MNRYIAALLLSAACLIGMANSYAQEPAEALPVVKGVILYLPTGMGDHQYHLLEAIAKGENRPTQMSRFSHQARMKTSLLGTPLPDTPGAASTLATGRKCPPKLLSMASDGGYLPTVFEEAQQSGRSVGLVTLGKLTNGAITAFAVHTPEEADFEARARQIFELRPQVLVGCDRDVFETARDSEDVPLLQRLVQDGYTVANDQNSLGDCAGNSSRRLFSASVSGRPAVLSGRTRSTADRFQGPLDPDPESQGILPGDRKPGVGPFLRWGIRPGRTRDAGTERSVEAGLRFSERFPDTLLVVVSPHETGNLMSLEDELPVRGEIQDDPKFPDLPGPGNRGHERYRRGPERIPGHCWNSRAGTLRDVRCMSHARRS
jgi:alkaline phosphatase